LRSLLIVPRFILGSDSRPSVGRRGSTSPTTSSAFLPLPLFDAITEAQVLQAAAALLGVALVGAGALAFSHWRQLRHTRRSLASAHALNERQSAVLATAPSGFWVWSTGMSSGVGKNDGTGGGALSQMFTVAADAFGSFSDVTALLLPTHAGELSEAVTRLRETGTGFSLRVETTDGRRIFEARGRRMAITPDAPASDIVWFCDITDAIREAGRLMERVTSLTEQNAALRHVFDGLAVPVWVRGNDLAIVYCNRAYARAVEEVVPAAAIAAGKEIAPAPAGWNRRLAEEALVAGESRTRRHHIVVDGQRRMFEISEFPLAGEDQPWRVAGLAVDLTESDDSRGELARHMAAHAAVLEKLGTGIVIYGPDTRVQFFNASFAAQWSLDPDWLRDGPTHGEMLEDLRARRMYPEQPDFQDYKRQRMELYTSLIDTQEELVHLPDEHVMRFVISPHPLGGLMFTSEDVTDRLTLERSYNTLIAVQSETFNNLHEGVAVYGADGRLKLFNPAFARIWRLDPDLLEVEPRMGDVLDAARDLFAYEGDWESFRDLLIANGADRSARGSRFERADGSILDYAAVPLPDGAMLFTYIDVTDSVAIHRALRERNEALLEADRLKSEFITNVSYELRTPLNTIIGFTEILTNQYFGTLNNRQSEYTRGVLEASQQLLALIDDILDLASIESGQLELDVSSTNVRAMLDSVVTLSRERTRKRDLALELNCPDDIGSFIADERRFKQAIFNLISNSVKHTPSGGCITLSAVRAGDVVEITVADTGIGIAVEDQQRVFETFERGGSGESHGGVGLGLALAKSFVDLHGGRLSLESVPGQGTTVRMFLPASPSDSDSGI
jgi:signal transduction histidine kinase